MKAPKCKHCQSEMYEFDLKEYDYNFEEQTMHILVRFVCDECDYFERVEIQGNITKVL